MKPSRTRTGLLTLLTTALLSLGGTAHAQLEEFVELLDDGSLSFFDPLFLKFTSGDIQKITVRGTIDTIIPEDTGVGPVFGLNGNVVPMVAYLFIDVSKTGPVENLAEGSFVGGDQLTTDLVGYKENQILGIYLFLGDPNGTKKEVGYLNADDLSPRLPAPTLDNRQIGLSGPIAKAWFDDHVDTGEPDACEFFLSESGSQFQMGSFTGGSGTFGFANTIWVHDGTSGKYAFGTVNSVDAVDASEALNRVLRSKSIADRLFTQAKTKLAKFKAKARKKGVAPGRYGPYKKALTKYASALSTARSLGLNPVE